ncbi:MAG: methyltransferase domain-containing protein [Deltaproteobacteria bacterium]|nr:methyltransferase domain-containing protein [Deltaproteobacteria bacterium]
MEHAFWTQRWSERQIGFHEGKPNALLAENIARFEKPKLRVLVPLCGKAEDLAWLAARGHTVTGVEFVPQAIQEFFAEHALTPARGADGSLAAAGVTLFAGDFFALDAKTLGTFDLIYDRAALVALEPSMRARYVAHCRSLLKPGGAIFLVAFAYDQTKAPGPPWSVAPRDVEALYAGMRIQTLAERRVSTSARLAEAGIEALSETAYLIAS